MYDLYSTQAAAFPSLPSPDDIARARHYVRPLLSAAVLAHIFDVDLALERALRIFLSTWIAIPQDVRLPFYTFVTTYFHSFTDLESFWDRDDIPRGAVPLTFPCRVLDAPTYQVLHNEWARYYIMDVVVSDYSRVIPSRIFTPYKDRSSQRCRQVLDRINPMPLWFFGVDGSLGFPIEDVGRRVTLLQGDNPLRLLNSHNKPITTLKVKFGWPNYRDTEKQIRAAHKGSLNTLNRLASSTAGAVRNFMSDERKLEELMEDKRPGFHPWQIGTQIRIADVLLLGVIFVSDGAAMPLLAVME